MHHKLLLCIENMSSTTTKDSNHGWSIRQFEEHRPELVEFIKTNICSLLDESQCSTILIHAPVKSGKREMVEYIAKRDESFNPSHVHAFVTAFHRIADEQQRKELNNHNLKIFSLIGEPDIYKCNEWIKKKIYQNKKIIIHIDECDFGSGSRQMLSKIYKVVGQEPSCISILYSATPQEVLFSGEVYNEDLKYQEMIHDIKQTGECVKYIPPKTFCGPGKFIDSKLVHEATPLFVKDKEDSIVLTNQGKMIIEQLKENARTSSKRNILLLRLSYTESVHTKKKNNKETKSIYQFIKYCHTITQLQNENCNIYVDKKNKDVKNINNENVIVQTIDWSSKQYWRGLTSDIPIIIVVDQTCSRSTELACHDRLYAIHDYRNRVTFSTSSQALERVNHYTGKYGNEFQKIHIFGHKKTIELSSGRISYKDYLSPPLWKKKKINIRKSKNGKEEYCIQSTQNPKIFHPNYCAHMTSTECDRALQELGCFAEVAVSSRVEGSIFEKKIYTAKFIPCNKNNFERVIYCDNIIKEKFTKQKFKNPFIESESKLLDNGKYKGYLRGWKVFDFDTEIITQCGWGVKDMLARLTICYRDGIEGVALRYYTGKNIQTSTLLTTNSSMYVK